MRTDRLLLPIRVTVAGWILVVLALCLGVPSTRVGAAQGGRPNSGSANASAGQLPSGGLVGWWPGEGDAKDRAGDNDGRVVGGVSFAPAVVGQGFQFNGKDGAI